MIEFDGIDMIATRSVQGELRRYEVRRHGEVIGYVSSYRDTYSPPVGKGSPIVRYHKPVTKWQAHTADHRRVSQYQDTRKGALRTLLWVVEKRDESQRGASREH